MHIADVFTDRVNLLLGMVTAIFSHLLGDYWLLFAFYLALNCGDFISRWIAAYLTGNESSSKGLKGIVKKVGYWLMIAVSFGMGSLFILIGEVIGVNLSVTTLLGWFVLATLSLNEVRSILENLVDAGYHIPVVLIKGLEVANKALEGKTKAIEEANDDETNN